MPAFPFPRPLLAAALLAALLAPPALAQETAASPSPALRVEPGVGEMLPGGAANVTLVLANPLDRPVGLALGASLDEGLRVSFERWDVRVPAQGVARVNATLRALPNATAGNHTVVFLADELAASVPRGATALHAKAPFALRVLDAAALPPRVSPDPVDVAVPRGQARTVTLKVENPGPEPRRLDVRFELPEGWSGVAERAPFDVPARSARPLNVTFRAGPAAQDGAGAILVETGDNVAKVAAKLRVAPALAPLATGTALADARAALPPGLTLRVDPAEADVPIGGTRVVDLVAENGGATPLSPAFDLVLPAGVRGGLGPVPAVIEPGATAIVPILLEGDALAPEGLSLEAAVHARDGLAAPATFQVRLVVPPPQEEPEAQAAGGAAAPGLGTVGVVAAAAAGVGGAAGLVAWLHRRWPLAFAALYTRLRPSSVLAQPVRERIAQLVRERPGITFGDLKRALGMGAGTLTHHARVLEGAGVLFSVADGQSRRFYPVGAARVVPTPPLDERALGALRQRGPMRASDLARELGVSRQALHYHLRRMMDEGRLVGRTEGRELILQAPPATTAPP